MLPQPREGEGETIAQPNVIRLLARTLLVPLVEAIRQDETPPLLECLTNGGRWCGDNLAKLHQPGHGIGQKSSLAKPER